jgi:hypothetical protein
MNFILILCQILWQCKYDTNNRRKFPFLIFRHFTKFSYPSTRSYGLTSESMNLFRHLKASWTEDRPIARPVHTQDSKTQKNADTHPSLERDSKPRSLVLFWRNSLSIYFKQKLLEYMYKYLSIQYTYFVLCSIWITPTDFKKANSIIKLPKVAGTDSSVQALDTVLTFSSRPLLFQRIAHSHTTDKLYA